MTGPWCVFVVVELASIDSCQHYHLIRFRLSTRDSLVPSRPRQFRMWRHLPDSANWPRYEAKKWQNRTLWRKFNQKPLMGFWFNSMRVLQTHAPEIFYSPRGTYEGVIFFISIRFQPFLTVHTNTMCMLFRFDQFPRAFWNLCVVDENAQSTSVNGRPTRIKMSSFSKENARIRGFSFEISEFFLPCNASFRK